MITVNIKYPEVTYRYEVPNGVRYIQFPYCYQVDIIKNGILISLEGLQERDTNIKTFSQEEIINLIHHVDGINFENNTNNSFYIQDINFKATKYEVHWV